MPSKKQNKLSIFIYHSGMYFYAFILIIIGMIINEIYSETILHKSITASKIYQITNEYEENSLVHLTDIITAKGNVGDNEYIYKQKNIIILKKTVEMYQWRRKRQVNHRYLYEKDWHPTYVDTNHKVYKNPKEDRRLGVFYYYPKSVHIGKIKLPIENFKANSYLQFQLEGSIKDSRNHHYIFLGKGTMNSPDLGDIRIRHQGYKSNQTTTIFATVSKNRLLFKNDKNYCSFYGTDLFQILYRDNIESVIDVYIEKENSFKSLLNFRT